MALLNKEENYIKVNNDGSYDIYENAIEREKVKSAPSHEVIVSKYQGILETLDADEERKYYDITNWQEEYYAWSNEMQRYIYDYQMKKGAGEYPLMTQYFENIKDTIPNIIQSGSIEIKTDTTKEIYELSKERKYWGETEDI